ncbi:uncharacterized protein EI90DRAFT_3117419 [Cantharellus anzutake]|uniref:uncharacterized protein n=1 Tax=Cantharellus anzutake TaxID=1750568 RepID=UPI001903DDCA|nr:uncharacterized protein EI90DRAFT_3117419 [Cantharellus anzutake]KAF8339610.1 hypothetical protein EI90DRAFT_3117419 [Cantharellus anzutake]
MPSFNLSARFPRSSSGREQPPAVHGPPSSLGRAASLSHSTSFRDERTGSGGPKGEEFLDYAGESQPESPSTPKRRFSFARPRRSNTVAVASTARSTTSGSSSRSFFLRGRNNMLAKTAQSQPPRVVSAPTIYQSPGPPGGSLHSASADDDEVLETLREAAAKSIGITLPTDELFPGNRVSFGDPPSETKTVKQRSGGVRFQEPGDSRGYSASFPISVEAVPPFPCLFSLIESRIGFTSTVSKYCAPPPLVTLLGSTKSTARHWKPRHLALTSVTTLGPNSTKDEAVYIRTDYLHLFKGSSPNDREVDRLLLTGNSAATLPDEQDNLWDRQCVIKVNGYHAKVVKQDEEGTFIPQGEMVWLLQCPDSHNMQKWLVSIRNAVLNHRCWQAGLTKRSGTPSGMTTVRSLIEGALTPDGPGSEDMTSEDESLIVPKPRPHTSLGILTNQPKSLGLRGLFINHQSSVPSSPIVAERHDWKSQNASCASSPAHPGIFPVPKALSSPIGGARSSLTTSTLEVSQGSSLTSVEERSTLFPPEEDPHSDFMVSVPPSALVIEDGQGRASSEIAVNDAVSVMSKPSPRVPAPSLEEQMAPTAVPARLLVSVPITPVEERFFDFSSVGVNGPKRARPTNPRVVSLSTNTFEGDRERENFQRFLASPSYNPSILGTSPLRGMVASASTSLPPPPRSRRATTSYGTSSHPFTKGGRASPRLVHSRSRSSLDTHLGVSSALDTSSPSITRDLSGTNIPKRLTSLSGLGTRERPPDSGSGEDGHQRNGSDLSNISEVPTSRHHRRHNSDEAGSSRRGSSASRGRSRLDNLPVVVPRPRAPGGPLDSVDTVVYNPSKLPWRQAQGSEITSLGVTSQDEAQTHSSSAQLSIEISSSHSTRSVQSHSTDVSNDACITPTSTESLSPIQSNPPYIHPYAALSLHSFGIHGQRESSISLTASQAANA